MSGEFQLEFPFVLPCGLPDSAGGLQRAGVMRRATARDELAALAHPLARANEPYMLVILLSRVVLRLGDRAPLRPEDIESLFATDFAYLQELYLRINGGEPELIETRCPTCGSHFLLDLTHDSTTT